MRLHNQVTSMWTWATAGAGRPLALGAAAAGAATSYIAQLTADDRKNSLVAAAPPVLGIAAMTAGTSALSFAGLSRDQARYIMDSRESIRTVLGPSTGALLSMRAGGTLLAAGMGAIGGGMLGWATLTE